MEFIKEIKKPAHANYRKNCLYCGREFDCVRVDAKFCTPLCRVKYNNSNGVKPKNGKFKEIKEEEKIKEAAKIKGRLKDFDFMVDSLGLVQYDRDWKNFQEYLHDNFGLPKKATSSFKKVKIWVDEINRVQKTKIEFIKLRTKEGTRIQFLVN